MTLRLRYIIYCFSITTVTLQAQSVSQSIRDDRKRMLIESVKPPVNIRNSTEFRNANSEVSIDKNNVNKYINQSKTGGAAFDDKYQVSEHLKKFTDEQLFKVETGQKTKVMLIDGKIRSIPIKDYEYKLDEMSQRHRLQGLMISGGIGGLNLSGWKKKKMTKKAKMILQHVYGMEIEE